MRRKGTTRVSNEVMDEKHYEETNDTIAKYFFPTSNNLLFDKSQLEHNATLQSKTRPTFFLYLPFFFVKENKTCFAKVMRRMRPGERERDKRKWRNQ